MNRRAMLEDKANYPGSLGSVQNHVLLNQTVIGQEAKSALANIGLYPDVVIGCHGGGSQRTPCFSRVDSNQRYTFSNRSR